MGNAELKNGITVKGVIESPIDFFKSQAMTIQRVLPDINMSVERMQGIFMGCILETPDLQNCTPRSWCGAIIQVAQYGLNPLVGECYLLPYRNYKTQKMEVQFQLGYKGMVTLLERNDITVFPKDVYEKDDFEVSFGLNPDLKHKPCMEEDRGEIIGAYVVATLPNGRKVFDYMTKYEIKKCSDASPSVKRGKSETWTNWIGEMYKKTVIRRISKILPLSEANKELIAKDEHIINVNENATSATDITISEFPEQEALPAEIEEVTTDKTMVLLESATVK